MERRQSPVHRTIIVVDVEGFGDRRRTNSHQVEIRAGLYRALRHAFDDARVSWTDCDHEDRGDGVFILAPAEMPKAPFVDALPHTLVVALREYNSTHPAEEQIRLRMALHAGEVAYDEHGVTAASVNLTFRLLDAHPLKAALAESPGVLALIASEWFFDEVVRHSPDIDPATFRRVRVTVKETSTVAWISLPDYPYSPDVAQLAVPRPREPEFGPVPHQLPAAPGSFTGRTKELARLTAALDNTIGRGATVVISAIAGAGGMGKTWLALQWAHQHVERFPDGQLFVDLRGFSPDEQPMPTAVTVRGFLDAFGVDLAHVPVDPHAQTARYRSLVAGKRMLIVLDNAVSTAQVTPLLPGSSTCTVLITSRNHLPGLITSHGARHMSVDVLSGEEARALLTARIGAERIAAEPAAVDELLAFCAGFPLALSIVAGRAHIHPHLPLATLATELHEIELDALDENDPAASLPKALSWSYRALTREQTRVFGLLSIAPGPDISLPAAASLTGLQTTDTTAVLRRLEQASLLSQDTSGRYGMHDLIRNYAADHANRDQPAADRAAALRRVVDFYLHTAHIADRLIADPHATAIELDPPVSGARYELLPDFAAAMAWFDVEQTCLMASQQAAAAHGWHRAVWQLAATMDSFHHRRGHPENFSSWQAGLAAANYLADPILQTVAHRLLGRACARVSRHDEALEHLRQALTLATGTEHLPNQAHTNLTLSWAYGRSGENRLALQHVTEALRLYQNLGNAEWEAKARNETGWFSAQLGEYDAARGHCEAALALHREHHNRDGESDTLDSLGYIAHHTGDHSQAVGYYQQALIQFRELGHAYGVSGSLERIGHPLVALGQHEHARAVWREALEMYQAQHRTADADRVQLLLDSIN